MTTSNEKTTSRFHGKTHEVKEKQESDTAPRWFTVIMGILTFAMAVVTIAIYVRA